MDGFDGVHVRYGVGQSNLRGKVLLEFSFLSYSKDLKVNLGKIKVMVIGGITNYGFFKSKVYPCGFCD